MFLQCSSAAETRSTRVSLSHGMASNQYAWRSLALFLLFLAKGFNVLISRLSLLYTGEGSRTSARNHKNFETLTTTWENSSDGGSSSGVEVELASDEQPRRMLQAIEPGSVWTLQNTPTSNSYTAVTFGNGTFVAVASEGTNFNKVMSPHGQRTSRLSHGLGLRALSHPLHWLLLHVL